MLYSINNTDSLLNANIGNKGDVAGNLDTSSLIAIVRNISNKISSNISLGGILETSYTVTTSSGIALAANASTTRRILYNRVSSTTNAIINFTGTATLTTGIPIPPGYLWIENYDNGAIHRGSIAAIASAVGATLSIMEWS